MKSAMFGRYGGNQRRWTFMRGFVGAAVFVGAAIFVAPSHHAENRQGLSTLPQQLHTNDVANGRDEPG